MKIGTIIIGRQSRMSGFKFDLGLVDPDAFNLYWLKFEMSRKVTIVST